MADMQVGVPIIDDDKGFYGLVENKQVKDATASSNPSLQVSVSFGRFEADSLSWEKFSAFSPNKYLEEVGKCATPGSVAQKKAYFEAHYKKIAERKAEIMDQEKVMDKNASFRSVVTDQGNVEEGGKNGGLVIESGVDGGSNGKFTCEEDKHVTDIADAEVKEVSVDEFDEETIVVKECQTSVDQVKEEVKDSQESEKSEDITLVEEKKEVVDHIQVKPEEIVLVKEKSEVIVHVQEKPVGVLQVDEKEETEVREEVSEKVPSKDDSEKVKKERKHNVIKKNDRNVQMNPTRGGSVKPSQVTTKPTTNKTVTSRKTPPSKEIRSMIKKPAASVSKAPPGFSTPKVYKPATQTTSLTTSVSSVKKENVSAKLRNKQTAPKSLHMSLSLGPSASDPTALTGTRKSLIMERMGDKDIVKRAFKTFRKSFDLNTSSNDQNTASKENPPKATSIPSVATRQKENGRPTKASSVEKRSGTNTHHPSSRGLESNVPAEKQQKELSKSSARPVEKTRLQKNPKQAGAIDAKTRRDSLTPKAKPVQGSHPVRASPKVL